MENDAPQAQDAPAPDLSAVDDSTILSELSRLGEDGSLADEPASDAEPAEPAEATEAPAEGDAQEAAAQDDSEPEPVADEAKPDPDLDRRLEAISRQEQRAKEQVMQARSELEQMQRKLEEQQSEWQQRMDSYAEAQRRAQYDPVGVLRSLGISEEHFEDAARAIYEASPAADPKVRGRAKEAMAAREAIDLARKAQQEASEARKQLEQYQAQQQQQQQVSRYMSEVTKAIGDGHKLVSGMLGADPAEADTRLRQAAYDLAGQTGEVADPSDVVAHLEKVLTAERDRYVKMFGLAAVPPASAKSSTPDQAAKSSAAKTISSDLGTATQPRTEPQTEEELDAELVRMMRAGQIE